MINTYYLVLGQMDAYITQHWFTDLKAAETCAESVKGKECIIETIEVNGTLDNICFSDCEYQPCKGCGKIEPHCNCDTCGDCYEIEQDCK